MSWHDYPEKLKSQEKPRIRPNSHRHQGLSEPYKFRCEGRGSKGYGDTPRRAFDAWLKNYERRLRHYVTEPTERVRLWEAEQSILRRIK